MTRKLNKKDLDFFRSLLLEKRAIATGDLSSLNSFGNGDLDGAAGDEADLGSSASQQAFALSLMENEAQVVREIDEALERIDNGTYGICQKSGKQIAKARLQAIPWAKLTIEAQRDEEESNGWS